MWKLFRIFSFHLQVVDVKNGTKIAQRTKFLLFSMIRLMYAPFKRPRLRPLTMRYIAHVNAPTEAMHYRLFFCLYISCLVRRYSQQKLLKNTRRAIVLGLLFHMEYTFI